MTLVVDLLVIAGGVVLGRWIARSIRARKRASISAESPQLEEPPASRDPLRGFPCKLGDVILRAAEHDEAWLAGALVFAEEAPVAALFVAPEAGGDRALFVRPGGGSAVMWLAPLPAGSIGSRPRSGEARDGPSAKTQEPPHTLELAGTRFERTRRLPMHVSRVGTGAPEVGKEAIVFEYAGAVSERVIVVAGTEQALSWRGVLLSEGEYEVLPGAEASGEGSS